MQQANDTVNLKNEFQYVIDLVFKNWNTNNEIIPILKMAWDYGIEESSKHQYVSSGTSFSEKINKLDFFSECSEEDKAYVMLYHRPFLLKHHFNLFNDKMKSDSQFYFSDAMSLLDKKIKSNFKNYKKNKPKLWISHRKKYKESPWEYDDTSYVNSFQGHEVTTNQAISGSLFPKSTSLLELTYMHERMETHPLLYLAYAVFSHARLCNLFNISLKIYNEFKKIQVFFKKPEYLKEIVSDFDFSLITNNEFINNISKSLSPAIAKKDLEEQLQEHRKYKKEFDMLAEEEKNKIKKENIEVIQSMLIATMKKKFD